MPKEIERDIEKSFRELLERRYKCKVERLAIDGRRGWPDLSIFKGGRVVFVEMKRPGEVCSPHQDEVRDELEKVGLPVFVVCNILEGVTAVGNAFKDMGVAW